MHVDLDGVLFTGGEAPPWSFVAELVDGAGRVVAADSGLDVAERHGVYVDQIVGDMDSLADPSVLDGYTPDRVHRYGEAKDLTDTEIGIKALVEDGCSRIGVLGGGGGRLDHLIALLYLFHRTPRPRLWVTGDSVVGDVDSQVRVVGHVGERVSFFPVGDEPCSMVSEGLQWELTGLEWSIGDVGVSNRITAETMTVEMRSGRLIVVAPVRVLEGLAL